MSNTTDTKLGLNSGRRWTALPERDHPLEWCMDATGEFLQGPLDMAFLRGKKVFLNLKVGQVALLHDGQDLQAVFLDGGHILDVGTRPGQVNPDNHLIFLDADRPVDLRWTHGNPVDLPGHGKRHIIGICRLQISGPACFFENILRHCETAEPDVVLDAIEKITRLTLTTVLDSACNEGFEDQACLQTTLMGLQVETLNEDLVGYGLNCTHLALYTAQPPVEDGSDATIEKETAGHSGHLSHN